jgi:hypothetical protein
MKIPIINGVMFTTNTHTREVRVTKHGITLVEEYLEVCRPQAYQDKLLVSQVDPQVRETILDLEEEVEVDHRMVVDPTQEVRQE